MILDRIVQSAVNWNDIPSEKSNGANGFSLSKTRIFGDIKIRQIHYSIHFVADDWCRKGHILHVLVGELIIEYNDGTINSIVAGNTYIVGDYGTPHMAKSNLGARVLVID